MHDLCRGGNKPIPLCVGTPEERQQP